VIRLSEFELQNLSQNTQRQKKNVDDVQQAGQTAVNTTDSEWQSSAFDTFKALWQRDSKQLTGLADELARWIKQTSHHADVAHQVNLPFQG
jgi:uncharacterized protein YukE